MGKPDKIIEQGTKTALRWKEEMPRVLTSCGEAFNYSIDKTGDAVWAGVFEKDKPNEAARFKVCADEDEAREFCKMIEGSGKLPLCMGRNAAAEDAGADVAGDQTITLPEYGEELQDVSGSGRMPKSASAPDGGTVQAVVDWLMAGDLSGYDHGTAMSEYGNRYWQIVRDALDGDLYEAVVAKLEADGIEGDWKEGKTAQQMPVDPKEMSEEELKKRAIRDNMKAENDAIMMYSAYIDLLPEGDPVRKGLEDIRDEEKEHAGELHKLLIDLDPSEEDEFNEGIGEVEKESGRKVGEAGVYVSEGRKERSMKDSVEQRHRAARRLHDKSRKAAKTAKTAANYSDEYPGGDGSLYYRYNYDTGMVETLLPEDAEPEMLDIFDGRVVDEIGFERGDWEESPENAIAMIEDRSKEDMSYMMDDLMVEFGGKEASADLAPQVSYHDDERPFYAYYEGQTKDKKATIGVVQQQIGSKPQLTVVSDKGQVHEFGFLPNMDYAMRQAERFEKMTYNELMAAAPPKTVRVTTAGKTAQSADYALLDRLRSDNEYFLGMGNRSEKHLWAGNVEDQIAKMRELWNGLEEKPEWLTEEQIDDYERRMKEGAKTAQYASESWNKVGDDYWYKGIGKSGSINVSWVGWTNLPGNLYYDERGCYAYYDGEIDGSYNGSVEVARVKTVSIAGLPSEMFQNMSYDEILAKYDNPQDGFCEKEPAMEYCARLADEWIAQNEQHLASKTASDGWDEDGGVWGKFEDGFSLEVDYDYSTPGKYHWEVIDMSKGGASGEKVEEGDEDTLEGAQSAATQAAGRREGSAKTAATPGSDTGRTTPAPQGWTKFETMGGFAPLGSPWRFTGDGKIVNADVEDDGTYNWYWVTQEVGVKGFPRKGYFGTAQEAIDDALAG